MLVSLVTADTLGARADGWLQSVGSSLLVSDMAAAEFAAVVSRKVRTSEIGRSVGLGFLEAFDLWVARAAQRVATEAADIVGAETVLRRLDLPLRAPDAIHLASARRLGASIATFDAQMATCARRLGLDVATA